MNFPGLPLVPKSVRCRLRNHKLSSSGNFRSCSKWYKLARDWIGLWRYPEPKAYFESAFFFHHADTAILVPSHESCFWLVFPVPLLLAPLFSFSPHGGGVKAPLEPPVRSFSHSQPISWLGADKPKIMRITLSANPTGLPDILTDDGEIIFEFVGHICADLTLVDS